MDNCHCWKCASISVQSTWMVSMIAPIPCPAPLMASLPLWPLSASDAGVGPLAFRMSSGLSATNMSAELPFTPSELQFAANCEAT